jgi:hypothetical protein
MKQRRVVGRVKGVMVVVPVRPFPLAKQDRVHQFKPFTLVIVKGKLKQGDGINIIDDKITNEGQKGQANKNVGKKVEVFIESGISRRGSGHFLIVNW